MPYKNVDDLHRHGREYYIAHREERIAKAKEYAETHVDERRESARTWRARNEDRIRVYMSDAGRRRKRCERQKLYAAKNRERLAGYRKSYDILNLNQLREKRRIYRQKRYRGQVEYRLRVTLKARLQIALKMKGAYKHKKTTALLGCTVHELRIHLESKFTPGMSWDNYGRGGWEVDHIRPCASFALTDPEQQKICFHFSNLQPLWAAENRAKSNKEMST